MKPIIIISLLLIGIETNAQSLIDKEIDSIASEALTEGVYYCQEDALLYAGVLVMEVATGNVVADVSLFYKDGEFIKNPYGNMQPVPSGLGRSVLYLAMMPQADPSMVIDTGDGMYIDSYGYTITDHNHKRGGYGMMDLKHSYIRNSDIGMLKAAETVFGRDMKKLSEAMKGTAISMGGRVTTGYGVNWQSYDVLGYSTSMSLLQQVCWINAVAGGKFFIRKDHNDATMPFDSISNKEGLYSLRSAMRECVTNGMERKMDSKHVSVAGITNTSQEDTNGYKGQLAAAFVPYEKPKYTIGVYIMRKGNKGYANPSNVIKYIIDWLASNRLSKPPYLSLTENQSLKHRDGWVHPAAR